MLIDKRQDIIQIAGLDAVPITQCNLGHSDEPDHLWNKDGFDYYRCPQCGLVWVSPQLTNLAVAQIYSNSFSQKHSRHQHPDSFLAYQPLLKKLEPYRNNNRLLDIGCFTGTFLLAAREMGWDVEGTEISEPAIEYARAEYDLTIHPGDLTTIDLPENYYDAVVLSDVIEHVSDPMANIERIHRILRPGGILYMDTPHFYSVPYLMFGKQWSVFFPWHRTYFSVPNMRIMLEQAGFKIRTLAAIGVLPMSRSSAWESYQSPKHNNQKHPSFIKRYKNTLRPFWLGFKWLQQRPFVLLSHLGIHIGAKLVVYAEKQ